MFNQWLGCYVYGKHKWYWTIIFCFWIHKLRHFPFASSSLVLHRVLVLSGLLTILRRPWTLNILPRGKANKIHMTYWPHLEWRFLTFHECISSTLRTKWFSLVYVVVEHTLKYDVSMWTDSWKHTVFHVYCTGWLLVIIQGWLYQLFWMHNQEHSLSYLVLYVVHGLWWIEGLRRDIYAIHLAEKIWNTSKMPIAWSAGAFDATYAHHNEWNTQHIPFGFGLPSHNFGQALPRCPGCVCWSGSSRAWAESGAWSNHRLAFWDGTHECLTSFECFKFFGLKSRWCPKLISNGLIHFDTSIVFDRFVTSGRPWSIPSLGI